jgi:iron(II)-dependent oxidoreductase
MVYRNSANAELGTLLADARAHTHALLQPRSGAEWIGPYLTIVNPPLWEFGHVAWFQEYWCLRRRPDGSLADSQLAGADALYNSSKVTHISRWQLPLPSLDDTYRYAAQVLERVQERLAREPDNAELGYFARLALLHEDMHDEAFHYTWQTHGYPAPRFAAQYLSPAAGALSGDVELAGGPMLLGAPAEQGFVFDNEKWQHEVTVAPFAISRAPVSNREYQAFVDDGGYRRREWWSEAGWHWREQAQAEAPAHWRRDGTGWAMRCFDQWLPLAPDQPVLHVNWHEANAWCRWSGRRLPSEAEWEMAAAGPDGRSYPWSGSPPQAAQANLDGRAGWCADVAAYAGGDSPEGCRQLLGNVWEWTATPFAPYPGFRADPYEDYSQPWFGNHYVLRGGSFATRSRLIRNVYRNFYLPERRDIFAGFRTCAL